MTAKLISILSLVILFQMEVQSQSSYYRFEIINTPQAKEARSTLEDAKKEKDLKKYYKAIELHEKVFPDGHPDLGNAYKSIASFCFYREEYDCALTYKFKLLPKDLSGDVLNLSSGYRGIGQIYYNMGNFSKSMNYMKKAIDIVKDYKSPLTQSNPNFQPGKEWLANLYDDLGGIYSNLEAYDKALEFYYKSINLKGELKNTQSQIGNTYSKVAEVQVKKGDYDSAIDTLLKKAFPLKTSPPAFEKNDPNFLHNSHDTLGEAYYQKKDFENAMKSFEIYYVYADNLSKWSQTTSPNYLGVAAALDNIGKTLLAKGDLTNALLYLEKARTLRKEKVGENSPEYKESLFLIGEVYEVKGDLKTALSYYEAMDKNLDLSRKKSLSSNITKIKLLRKLNRNKEVISVLKDAVDKIIKYRYELGSEKAHFTQRYLFFFEDLIAEYIKANDWEEAFYVSEKMRGLSIAENLNQESALKAGGVPIEKINEFDTLQNNLASIQSKRSKAISSGEIDKAESLWKEYSNLERDIYSFDSDLIDKYPEYAKLKRVDPVPIKTLQKKIKATNQTIVEYIFVKNEIGKQDLYAFVITKDEFKTILLEKNSKATDKVIALRKIISTRPEKRGFVLVKTDQNESLICDDNIYDNCKFSKGQSVYRIDTIINETPDGKVKNEKRKILIGKQEKQLDRKDSEVLLSQLSKELYSTLIQPIEKQGLLKDKSIVISPDGILYSLPFSALVDTNNKYLIESYNLVTIHSLTVWNSLKEAKKEKGSDPFFGIGNPVYNISLKPEDNSRAVNLSQKKLDFSFEDIEQALAPLPGSKVELEKINELFYAKSPNNNHIKTEVNANKNELIKIFRNKKRTLYDVIHFSAHGLFFNDNPELNAIALTTPSHAKKFKSSDLTKYEKEFGKLTEDGFLKYGEIIDLEMHTNLIVLSACETSLGTQHAGDGMVGLPQAFLIGGAKNVLATLWKVDDVGTKEFFVKFYSDYKTNSDKSKFSDLLTTTQKEFSNKDKDADYFSFNDPYFWSAFVLYGD